MPSSKWVTSKYNAPGIYWISETLPIIVVPGLCNLLDNNLNYERDKGIICVPHRILKAHKILQLKM